MLYRNFSLILFFFLGSVILSFQVSSAESYFDRILAGVRKTPVVQKVAENLGFKNPETPENIYIGEVKNYFPDVEASSTENVFFSDEEFQSEAVDEYETQKVTENKKSDSLIAKILEKMGLGKSPGVSNNIATVTPNYVDNSQTGNPSTQSGMQPNSIMQLLSGLAGKNSFGNQGSSENQPSSGPGTGPAGPGTTGPGVSGPGATTPETLATPYNGPGGSLPGECGIPKGPIAYNIGGNNVKCSAKTIVSGFKAQLRQGVFGAGYINPLTEKGQGRPGSSARNCVDSSTASQYGEGCFSNYASGPGQAYIQEQLLHWQAQGRAKGQKCVPVDIDNCDSIGNTNYKNILDQVENFNNRADIKIKVLTKNPHLAGCNFFSHPAVVGAFIEEISPSEAQKVSKMRNKPEQILLFARGGSGTNQKLKQIENLKIPNSSYSYDQGAEYQNITDCTYNP